MRVVFIVNPTADRGKAKGVWKTLLGCKSELFSNYEVIHTEYQGHARVIASEISEETCDVIVSVGGDGTIHEIVNGIVGKDISLGIIPAGSGNDLARTLGISKDPKEALLAITNKSASRIDLGVAGDRYFINIGGAGFDAEVVADMNNNMRFLRGTVAYVASVIKKLLTFVPVELEITIDGRILNKKVYICAVANGKYYGGGMMLAPDALINDGYFDICVLEDLSKLDFLVTFPSVFKGKHIDHPKVKIYKGKEVLIKGPEHLSIHADGEIFGRLPARFFILPNALRIMGTQK